MSDRPARLTAIREGRCKPRMSVPAERAAWRQYMISKGMKAWWRRRKAVE